MRDNKILKNEDEDVAAHEYQTDPTYRILVVDDNSDIRRLNAKVLIEAGYHVGVAENGAEAWNALQNNSYDLLLTDNNMPRVTGVELIKKLHIARMGLPVIMATAQEIFAPYPWLRPIATLLKPYTITELLATVKEVFLTMEAAVY